MSAQVSYKCCAEKQKLCHRGACLFPWCSWYWRIGWILSSPLWTTSFHTGLRSGKLLPSLCWLLSTSFCVTAFNSHILQVQSCTFFPIWQCSQYVVSITTWFQIICTITWYITPSNFFLFFSFPSLWINTFQTLYSRDFKISMSTTLPKWSCVLQH